MKSYDDPAKRLSREKLYEFILKHLIRGAGLKPKEIKVVCLETPEALEIKEVYDRLEIPRANITVIERDPDVAKQIEAQNLGVKVVTCWDYEYFETTQDGPFHIISLDYKGKKNATILNTIALIASRQLLAHHNSIMLVNTYGSRESTEQDLLLETAKIALLAYDDKPQKTGTNANSLLASVSQVISDSEKLDVELAQARDIFTSQIIGILGQGDFGKSFCHGQPLVFCYPYSSDTTQRLKALYEREGGIKLDAPESLPVLMTHHLDNFKKHLIAEFKMERFGYNVHVQDLCDAIFLIFMRRYYAGSLERYKYVSLNGAPMELDLFHVIDYEKVITRLKKIITVQEKNYGTILKVDKNQIKNYGKFHGLICSIIADGRKKKYILYGQQLPERIFLGSSSKMLKEQKDQDASY